MSSNLQNTGFTVGSNQFDIANMVTSWSTTNIGGNRILPTSSSLNVFPQLGYGFSSTINGQIVSIFNLSGSSFKVYVLSTTVYFNGVYYDSSNNNFTIDNNKIATFVLIQGGYYVQIAYTNI